VEAQAMVTRKFLGRTMTMSVRFKSMLKMTLMICIWMLMMRLTMLKRLLFCGRKFLFRALVCATCEAASAKNPRCLHATKAPPLPKTFLLIARLLSAF
jgi:hypothetical protein